MEIMRVACIIIFMLVSVALTALVLMQEGKSAGLGAISGAAETYWGKNKGRSMEGTLVKLTRILAVVFVILAFLLNMSIF
ncbi:MAG: preprotein translocase subunit SecG [Lachnospiraceae bacterium]|nr:preprotein translocase subunit SecG [Lachnospiraceae bacterium]